MQMQLTEIICSVQQYSDSAKNLNNGSTVQNERFINFVKLSSAHTTDAGKGVMAFILQ